ncbi:TKL family protein kinase [Trichomonas vaginalis G3]|uniref:TKL family protein kinase n=1 Tax=Trichomonas vaginalis (strain ATCC PRA-98 / G3) TaxID=412133 RepID=A2FJX1_TRIV3|nr:protein kinase protein [Trichomonas vaginalis G3]EAX94797.1 TKL family protein kinase [Trichomonas vaginalis G3]KAI5531100.1 protein kinase protein [Trichomonas vaginalis G3]|eukprot:XP_001307727.1 TKL family protein kinase [Trichomonas vaginalis G3]
MSATLKRSVKVMRSAVHKTIKRRKLAYCHNIKINSALDELQSFYDRIDKKKFTDTPITDAVANSYNEFAEAVSQLQFFIDSIDENNYSKNIILQKPDYYIKRIIAIKQSINEKFEKLNLDFNPPFDKPEKYDMSDEYDDISKLKTIVLSEFEKEEQDKILPAIDNYLAEIQQALGTKSEIFLNSAEVRTELEQFSSYFVRANEFEIGSQISTNPQIATYLGTQKNTSKPVLIQKLNFNERISVGLFKKFKLQIEVLSKCKHFALCKLIGITNSEPYYIITEYYPESQSLFSFLHEKASSITETNKLIIALGVAYGMAYLHSIGVIYRNLKSPNVFLDSDFAPHIFNFETSRFSDGSSRFTPKVGTLNWMAPEVYLSDFYTKKSDVYSYGMLLYELLTQETPFKNKTELQIINKVFSQKYRPNLPEDNNKSICDLISMCWDQDPDKRPSFPEIVSFFEKGDTFFDKTNTNVFSQYMKKCSKDPRIMISCFNIKEVSKENMTTFVNYLTTIDQKDEDLLISCFHIVMELMSDDNWQLYIVNSSIPNLISYQIRECSSQKLSEVLIQVCHILLKTHSYDELNKNLLFSEGLMNIFCMFGCSSLKNYINTLLLALENDNNKPHIKDQFFMKISQFMLIMDQSIAFLSFKLIKYLFDNEYDLNSAMLSSVIPLIFNNLIPNTHDDEQILMILEFLETLQKSSNFIVQMNLFDTKSVLLELIHHKQYSYRALKVLSRCCTVKKCTEIFAINFTKSFPRLINNFENTNQSHILLLFIFTSIMDQRVVYKIVMNNKEILLALNHCLMNNDLVVVLISLKICFSLISHEKNNAIFSLLYPTFIHLLKSSDRVAITASYCLSSLILNKVVYDHDFTEILDFICNSFQSSDNTLILSSLKLCGSISQTYKGTQTLAKHNSLISYLVSLIDNETVQYTCLSVLLSITAYIPFISSMEECIEKMLMISPHSQSYSLVSSIFSNMSVSPQGSVCLCPYISKIADRLIHSKEQSQTASLAAIERIVSAPETHEIIIKADNYEWVKKLLIFLNTPHVCTVFNIMFYVSTIYCDLCDIISVQDVDFYINQLLNNPDINQGLYFKLTRLRYYLE